MYVHCSERNCYWEQDDFWSKHYNPWTRLKSDFQHYWKPRMIQTESKVFSWWWLVKCIFWRLCAPFKQKWWTHEEFKKATAANDGHYPPCPKCGGVLWSD